MNTTATFKLFARIPTTGDHVEIGGHERLQALELESHGLIRTSGGAGKTYVKLTASGMRIADAFFKDGKE